MKNGSTATTYEPYWAYELANIGTAEDFPFKAVNEDEYYDSLTTEQKSVLTYDKWYIHKEIGKYTIPNNVGGYNSTSNWYYVGVSNFTNIKTTSGTEILCNYFKNINIQLEANANKNGIYNIGTHIVLRNTALSSTSNYQNWISNDKIFYTLLATPTNTEITETSLINQLEAILQAKSYNNQTNISQTNEDLPFILDLKALRGE